MKKYMSIFTLMLIVFMLFACAENKQTQENTENQVQDDTEKGVIITDTNAGYEIEVIDGEYYVVFEDEKYKNNVNASQVEPSLTFSSVAEMKDKLLNGKLTEDEIEILSTFSKDNAGKIKIPNLEKVYMPIVPENVTCFERVKIGSGGTGYSVKLASDDCYIPSFDVQSKQGYENQLKATVDLIHNNKLVTIIETVETKERDATIYLHTTSAGKFKRVEYTIVTAEGKIFVAENYRLETIHATDPVSDVIPYVIELHGDFGDRYFYCSLFNFTERPSVEWLSSFGLTEVK